MQISNLFLPISKYNSISYNFQIMNENKNSGLNFFCYILIKMLYVFFVSMADYLTFIYLSRHLF